MVLVSVSSINEPNNSKFVNFFQNVITIPKDASVSLINASLVVAESLADVTIAQNQFMNVCFDCWNIIAIPLIAGTLNINNWITQQNAVSLMTTSNPIYDLAFTSSNEKLTLSFTRKEGTPVEVSWYQQLAYQRNFYGGLTNTRAYFLPTDQDLIPTTFPTALSVGTNSDIKGIKNTAAAAYEIVSHYNTDDEDYSYVTRGECFDWNRYMGSFLMFCGAACKSTYTLCNNNFVTPDNKYALDLLDYLIKANYKVNNKIDITRKDVDGTEVVVVSDAKYHPGSAVYFTSVGAPTGGGIGNFVFGQRVEKIEQPNGLQLWIPLDITQAAIDGGWNWADGQGTSGSITSKEGGSNIWQSIIYNDSDAQGLNWYNAASLGLSKVGWRAGQEDVFIRDEFVADGVARGLTKGGITTQMPDGGSIECNRSQRDVVHLFTNTGNELVANDNVNTQLPSLVMISFHIRGDGTGGHCIFSSDSNFTLKIDTSSVGSNADYWDFRFYQHNEYSDITATTYWDAIFQDIANYSINVANVAAVKPKAWFGVLESVDLWQPQAALDYNATFASDGTHPLYQWVVSRTAGAGVDNFLDHTYCNADPQNFTSFGARASMLRTVNAGSEFALANEGVAIINASTTDVQTILKLTETDTAARALQNADPTFTDPVAQIESATIELVTNLELTHLVNINNLPHRNLNGTISTDSKLIYEIPSVCNERVVGQERYKSFAPPIKTPVKLNNVSEIMLNQLEIEITRADGIEDDRIVGRTHLLIEIE